MEIILKNYKEAKKWRKTIEGYFLLDIINNLISKIKKEREENGNK